MLLKIRKKYIRAIIIKIIVIIYLLVVIVRGVIDITLDKKQYVSSDSLNGYEIYLLLKEEYPNLEYDTNLEKLADGYAERCYNGEKFKVLDDRRFNALYSGDSVLIDYVQASTNADAKNNINIDLEENGSSKKTLKKSENIGIGIYKEYIYLIALYKD